MKRVLVILAIATMLTGCGTTEAQRQAATTKKVVQTAMKDLVACRTAIYNKPEYESIREKLPSPANKFSPSMAQQADDSIPTKEEGELLILYRDDSLPCRREALSKIDSVAPSVATIIADGMVESDRINLKLVKRKVSWGKAERELLVMAGKARKQMMDAFRQIGHTLAISNQAELAQRQATKDSLAQFSTALVEWTAVAGATAIDLAEIRAQAHQHCSRVFTPGYGWQTVCQ